MKKKNYFKYLVLIVVLIIPFMYSFFYLKAYWNPYGEGNIDNLPVAIVNNDTGDKGDDLIDSIIDSKKLKISVVSESDANDGLYNGDYYAVINIPESFTTDMESIATTNKTHATITYSPNQKSNYLASQIINNVVNVVEKNLDNKVNSEIISSLEETVTTIPNELDTISDGFSKLEVGSKKLVSGSSTLTNGLESLNTNYTTFNEGLSKISSGSKEVTSGMNNLKTGINNAYLGSKKISDAVSLTISDTKNKNTDAYKNQIGDMAAKQAISQTISNLEETITSSGFPSVDAAVSYCNASPSIDGCSDILTVAGTINNLKNTNSSLYKILYQATYKTAVTVTESATTESITSLATLSSSLNELTTGLEKLNTGADTLSTGIDNLNNGINTLYVSSGQLKTGINSLYTGSNTLNSGINTLYTSVSTAKGELDSKINSTKESVKTVEGLSDYSEEPVVVNTTPVNEVSSYGTAFSPFFISIALWVGSLMMFMVLYYDKNERFGILGVNSTKRVQRTLAYHGLATASAIILGITLNLFLDFEITNIFLYYISLILIANAFMSIMNFLITNFNDIGKFLGLIILVLQLAAAGGTFPIETVTKCFRWLNPILPMTYTNKLMKESLVTIESNLLTKYVLIVFGIFLVFFVINICLDIYRNNKEK